MKLITNSIVSTFQLSAHPLVPVCLTSYCIVYSLSNRLQQWYCWRETDNLFLTAVSGNSVLTWNLLSPTPCEEIVVTGELAVAVCFFQ